ncbi:D-serine/D-alanine/glycine:proton symporter, AAT family [Polynucleobacter meluiroseus]|uniref:D-serine/D-alanine/glycine:proton symporter, AAT family n=1 Tax=Polynucleobacter meluiroseus TaxID=1938814 RepID=A0A240DZD1_9BURK|nr:amino acid permease [Polynucleobacter meluiroseus]SNX28044.1 D-serine/D-alanine/glycine:proton symporter, AAT family [Polynucleobacter meluiroseus]
MANTVELERGLGQRHIEMIAIGGCIGTGLFMGSGRTISLAGPGIIVIYGITGLILYFVMRAMGELLLYNLNYKSLVDFCEDILGPAAGFFVGWSYWFAWIVAAIAEIVAITGYMSFWFPNLPHWISALTIVILLLALNLLSVKAFGELEFWMAIIKVVAIVGLILLGLYLCFTGFVSPSGIKAQVSNLWSYGGLMPNGVSGLLAGLQTTIFAFAGMEVIGTMMAEAKDPKIMLPKAIRSIPVRIMLFYIGTVTVLMMITPWIDIPPDQSPFVGMFSMVGMLSAASVINLVVVSSATSSSNSGIYATSRMLYGLAQQHHAPAIFGKLSSFQIPAGGIFVATGLILSASLVLTTTESIMGAFELVGTVAALIFIFIWTMILLAYLSYRKRLPQAHQESQFKMPLSKITPYVALGFFAVVLYALMLNEATRLALFALPIWFIGLGIMYWLKTHRSADQQKLIASFQEKVIAQNAAAKAYRARSH